MTLHIQHPDNQDPTEIEKFNQPDQQWWPENDSNHKNTQNLSEPLHQINPLRLRFIQKHSGNLNNKRILDIGCGGGILSESLAKLGAHVTGIDVSEHAIKSAQTHLKNLDLNLNLDYYLSSAENFAEKTLQASSSLPIADLFDMITCMEMLEHVPSPESIIAACAKLLKPGGQIFLSTLNRNVKSYVYAIIGAEWILKLLPKNTHDYAKFIRPSELSQWLRAESFSIKDMTGLSYRPFSKRYYLTPDISVNYLLYAQKNEICI